MRESGKEGEGEREGGEEAPPTQNCNRPCNFPNESAASPLRRFAAALPRTHVGWRRSVGHDHHARESAAIGDAAGKRAQIG